MQTATSHQKAIARKSLKMNRVGRMMVGLPLADAYRIVFGGDLHNRLVALIAEYPNVVAPDFLSWELGCQQNASTTAELRALLAEVETESPR